MTLVSLPRPVLSGRRGVVSSGDPLAVGAGVEILTEGGNAVDAALASVLGLCVVLPHACGLGGDALLLVAPPGEPTTATTGNGAAPAAVPDAIPPDGGGTAAVPGLVAAVVEMHDRFGSIPLEAIVRPAARLARDGFPAGPELLKAIERQRTRLARGCAGWSLLDAAHAEGDMVRLPHLADVLLEIGGRGRDAFYAGPVAEAICSAAQADMGTLEPSDLAEYAALVGPAVALEVGEARVETSPPTSQGILLLMALRLLADKAPDTLGSVCDQVRALERCFAFRSAVAEPAAHARLLSDSVLAEMRDPAFVATSAPRGYNHTAAVATADADGLAVSGLVSVFDDFGSATLVPEHEFVLSSRLLGFDAEGPNAPAPRRRPVHTLAPCMVRTGDRSFAVATPGADGQVQTLLQLMSDVLRGPDAAQLALHRPRWRLMGGEVVVEDGAGQRLLRQLEQGGYSTEMLPQGDELFGAVSGAASAAGDWTQAVSDPRRGSWAGAW